MKFEYLFLGQNQTLTEKYPDKLTSVCLPLPKTFVRCVGEQSVYAAPDIWPVHIHCLFLSTPTQANTPKSAL